MGKNKEIERFEDRFSSEVIEIDAVTGAGGFGAEELLDLANDWYEESREEYYESFDPDFEEEDEYFKYETITKERFMELIEIQDIVVCSEGEFTAYCSDGDIFLGHSIIVNGNINGEFDDAQMAG